MTIVSIAFIATIETIASIATIGDYSNYSVYNNSQFYRQKFKDLQFSTLNLLCISSHLSEVIFAPISSITCAAQSVPISAQR